METEEIYHKDGSVLNFKIFKGETYRQALKDFYESEKMNHPSKIILEKINPCDCNILCEGCSRSDTLIEVPCNLSESIYFTILFAGFLFGFEFVELPTNLNGFKVTVRTKEVKLSNFKYICEFISSDISPQGPQGSQGSEGTNGVEGTLGTVGVDGFSFTGHNFY